MIEETNLNALRSAAITSDTIYVQGHTTPGDGGGGLFRWRDNLSGIYNFDNDGTIIESCISTDGKWVRQYDDLINVLYFGAFGDGADYTDQIQKAIDFAALNTLINSHRAPRGSTVFMPNGTYTLQHIILKTGINILGESSIDTKIYCANHEKDYLFEMEAGEVILNISNLAIFGEEMNRGCFLFEGTAGSNHDGGLWYSTFKNISINHFKGNGIYLKGGLKERQTPNQFNVFENVRIYKAEDREIEVPLVYYALNMTGQNGQHTFINCEFDGFFYPEDGEKKVLIFDRIPIINIENNFSTNDYMSSAVVTFLNCSIQNSDFGVKINYAENITFDNCWFESLGVALSIIGDNMENAPSKSINIINNRFANASGYGPIKVGSDNIKAGRCVFVDKSVVNIYNNYVAAVEPIDPNSLFVTVEEGNYGVNCYNNTFKNDNPNLSRTYGIMQVISVMSNSINCYSNKLIFVHASVDSISNIISATNAGEILVIRAHLGSISFDNSGNIFLTNRSTFTLDDGEIASFVKIDIGSSTNNQTYQLLSFTKTTP